MKLHAFVVMPFGSKPGPDGEPIHFDRVMHELLRPALAAAGCEVFRAEHEVRAGDIRPDLFQELVIADLVVADVGNADAHVWYELGVRHALRARGVVLVCGGASPLAFDTFTDRVFRYGLRDGAPDPATLAEQVARLATMFRETLSGRTRRRVSPVHALLPRLRQPDWHQLLLDQDSSFRDAYAALSQHIEIARQKNRPGDILTLADDMPARAVALQARLTAGDSLLKLQQAGFALEQFEAALAIDPAHVAASQKRVVCLCLLGRHEEATQAVRALTSDEVADAESWSLAGHVESALWCSRWRPTADAAMAPTDLQAAAAGEDAALGDAITPYLRAFLRDPSHHQAGLHALTLTVLREHLGGPVAPADTEALLGGVRWSVVSALQRDPRDYRARAAQAMLSLLRGDAAAVLRDYRGAVAASGRDWLALDSTLQSLRLLSELGFRTAETALALDIVSRELQRAAAPFSPRQVLLFSGHLMDAPDRPEPRFPAAMEAAAAREIGAALDALGADSSDLALCQAAAGGDLLFLEACTQRGVRCQVLLPFDEPAFIRRSILCSVNGSGWRERWFALKPGLAWPPRVMPQELGPTPPGSDEFERCNVWLLHTALAWGPDKLRFVCLWNGASGDGPGGTRHMRDEADRRTGRVSWIDTRRLG